MVLRMSIYSVPSTNSVFFASFPIDDLPIDKVWEKVRALSRSCQVAREKVSLLSNRRRPAIPLLSDTMRQFSQLTSDKTVITSISVQEWLDRLSPRFRRIAIARLSEIAEVSWITRNRRC